MNIFWEIHSNIPREGPGEKASTRRAWSTLSGLPAIPQLLDVGCGPGMQTIDLASCSKASILAIDTHPSFLDELDQRAARLGLSDRIKTRNMSMEAIDLDPSSFDVIWSEGAIYIMGFEKGLREWKKLLKPGGFLAVTELSWLEANVPEEPRTFWNENYPGMKSVDENLQIIRENGYRVIDHFTLPESAWWENYYNPLEKRIADLIDKYRDDEKALYQLHDHRREFEMYRKYSMSYGYVFYIMQAEIPDQM